MGGKKRRPVWKRSAAAVLLAAGLLLAACQSRARPDNKNQPDGLGQADCTAPMPESVPGEIRDGVYTGDEGKFTVKADESLWEVSEVDGDRELRLSREPSVWISFSASEGISLETVEKFETDFADSYVDAVKEGYPDARVAQICHVNEQMAGLHLTMTDPSGRFQMYQMLYLATDGADGYLITSTLSEEEEKHFRPAVEAVIESFEFQGEGAKEKAQMRERK